MVNRVLEGLTMSPVSEAALRHVRTQCDPITLTARNAYGITGATIDQWQRLHRVRS